MKKNKIWLTWLSFCLLYLIYSSTTTDQNTIKNYLSMYMFVRLGNKLSHLKPHEELPQVKIVKNMPTIYFDSFFF